MRRSEHVEPFCLVMAHEEAALHARDGLDGT